MFTFLAAIGWKWIVGTIVGAIGAGIYMYKRYDHSRTKARLKQANYKLKKGEIEDEAIKKANKPIDNPFDFLSK